MINHITLFDTETTGISPDEGASVLEIAAIFIKRNDNGKWHVTSTDSALIEYEGVIPPESRAVHHIGPEMVAPGAPGVRKYQHVIGSLKDMEHDEGVYATHNAAFDSKFLPELSRPWICTYRCALHIYRDAPSYKNNVLRYWLDLEPDPKLIAGLESHRALYDTAVTAELLLKMLDMYTPEQLVTMTNTPVLLETCNFGKHKGAPWNEVPRSYLNWMLRDGVQADNIDIQHTIRHHLGLPA